MKTLDQAQRDALEALVDSTSLGAVLEALQDLAHAKSEHVQANWQDGTLAAAWRKAGGACYRATVCAVDLGV